MIRTISNTLFLLLISISSAVILFSGILMFSNFTNTEVYVGSEFEVLLESFKKDAILHNTELNLRKHTTIMVDHLEPGILGTCYPHANTVTISGEYWEYLDEAERKALMYHEWGHCLLKREHVTDIMVSILMFYQVCPVSVMYPQLQHNSCFLDNEEHYIKELFKNQYKYPTIPEEDSHAIIFTDTMSINI